MAKIISTFILLLGFLTVDAQYAYFGSRGTIAFDKITFTKARARSMSQQWNNNPSMRMRGNMNVDNLPESTTEKMLLHFDENSTLLTLAPDESSLTSTTGRASSRNAGARMAGRGNQSRVTSGASAGIRMGRSGATSKTYFQDLRKNSSSLQLEIDDKYIITDTLNNITWRFTDEYRDIAGFECRRVNGATADSLYLVAFYTDQIPVSAGPALSSGLPGMILGLAIPEMHIQYWATQINYSNDTVPSDWKDKKATTLTFDEFLHSFGRIFQRGRDSNTARRQIQEQLIY